ncbi:MAG: transcription initiation factor IIB family protein [Candidatus Micrarchaeota archaeon]|nr:transcription initiation factor IIB family protein [Candidatus Micrarchaeota archaeon]
MALKVTELRHNGKAHAINSECNPCPKDRNGVHSPVLDTTNGELVCTKCSQVVERIQTSDSLENWEKSNILKAEKRGITHNQSVIGFKDGSGSHLSSDAKKLADRLKTWDIRTTLHGFKSRESYKLAMLTLGSLSDKLALGDAAIGRAIEIIDSAFKHKLTMKSMISYIAAASLHIASREEGMPKSLTLISKIGDMKRKRLAKAVRMLDKELNLKYNGVDVERIIARVANNTGFSEAQKAEAIGHANLFKEIVGTIGNPYTFAGSVLYYTLLRSKLHTQEIKQTAIAQEAGVTAVAIRNGFHKIDDVLSEHAKSKD